MVGASHPEGGERADSTPEGRSATRTRLHGLADRWIGRPGELSHTALHLMLSTGATSLIGLGFWAVAARLYSATAVGHGSAEVAAMSLLAGFAQLNLANAFIRYLPAAGDEAGRAVRLGYTLSLATAAVVSTAFIFTRLADTVVTPGWGSNAIFIVAVVFWTVFILQDGALTGLNRAAVVPVENVGFGIAKLALLPAMVLITPRHGVFLAWTLPVVVAVVAVSVFLVRRVLPLWRSHAATSGPSSLPRGAELRSFLSAEYAHSLVTTAASFLLPVLIVHQLGAVAEAHFYIPWLIYLSFSNLMANVSSGLVVAAAGQTRSPRTVRRALAMMAGIAAVGLLVAAGVPGPLLGVLSAGYAASGAGLLRFIGLALPFGVVSTLFVSYLWIERRIWGLVGLRFVQSIVLVGGTELFLHSHSIEAAGIAVLAESVLIAAVGLPILWRWYRRLADEPAVVGRVTPMGTTSLR
jgi:O-antigen/teichoic acid export membrane protein